MNVDMNVDVGIVELELANADMGCDGGVKIKSRLICLTLHIFVFRSFVLAAFD